jgi:sucrose-6-phosphate hydrolase SacC (GH32 family)
MMSKKLDRRTFLAKTAALSGSAVLVKSAFTQVAVAAENKKTNEREFRLEKQYLNLPVSYDEDDRVTLELVIDDKVVRTIDIFLPDSDPDFWVFADISEFKNKNALLRTRRGREKKGLGLVYQSDERKYLKNLYQEKHRPQVHFSTIRGWINDPNGLVYYDGVYHLYFQHYPYGYYWGQPNWGHAISKDLVHWKQLPDVLLRHELGGIYSGSSVVDYKNTSGFRTGQTDVLVAFYTTNRMFEDGDAACQNVAYSNDGGFTWTKYEKNPVIGDRTKILGSGNARDPKVIWHGPTKKWVMIVFERIGNSIFTSDNLKDWEYQSHIKTFWECPELFELSVDGNPRNKKWVMYGVNGDYLIGDFDGKKFTEEAGMFSYLQGKFFAAQTFNNVPKEDGRRIQIGYVEIIGWVPIPEPGMPFNGMMSFPTELTLRNTKNGVRMFNEPVKEIKKLYKKNYKWKDLTVRQANKHLEDVNTELMHIKCEIENISAIGYSFVFDEDVLYYGLKKNLFHYNRYVEGAEYFQMKYVQDYGTNTMSYEFIVDRTSLEVFVDKGRFTMYHAKKVNPDKRGMKIAANDEGQGTARGIRIKSLEVHELESIWK